MRIIHKSYRILAGLLFISLPALVMGESAPTAAAIDQAQRQITAYLDKLADLHCTESVTQEKLAGNGHVEATGRAKYDYLIRVNRRADDFQLNESRIESPNAHTKQPQLPMLVTNEIG